MAAHYPDEVLDPGRSIYVNLLPEEPQKKKRRTFNTNLERKLGQVEVAKKSAQSRITIGDQWNEWERQRILCGITNTKEFVAHLLAVHSGRCPQLCQVSGSLHTDISCSTVKESDNPCVECVTETPPPVSKKHKMESGDEFESPIIHCDKKGMPRQHEVHSTPEGGTSTRRALISSTPKTLEREADTSMISDHEVTFLTPIKDTESTRPTRLAKRDELPHSPKLFADSDSNDDLAEELDDDVDFREDGDDGPIEFPTTNWRNLRVTMGTNEAIEAQKCIAFNGVLERLLKVAVGSCCYKKDCRKELKFIQKKRGTCLLIIWECPAKSSGTRHSSGVWSSQPRVHNMDGGTVLGSIALTLSGNNFAKVALMAKFLQLNFFSQQMHNCIQKRFVLPAVNMYFEGMQAKMLRESQEPRIFIADGRNHSPGHTSTNLTYTLIDMASKKIIALATVDCLDTDHNSVIMERLGFQRAMDQVLGKVPVAEVVTDAHPQIRKLMSTDPRYHGIKHQWDVWHVAKNLAKRLLDAGRERGMGDIIPWIPSIKNHLWYASRTCGGDANKLRMVWQSVLNHVANRHKWIDTTGYTSGHCEHVMPLPVQEQERAWIKPGSKVQERLTQIIRKKAFVMQLSYLTNFRHTGELEQFHSSLLMYCPKRIPFVGPYYRLRCLLAAIDFNEHVDRPFLTDKDGKIIYRYYWSKGTKRWSATPAKVPKRYLYIKDLMAQILSVREKEVEDKVRLATPMCTGTRRKRNIALVPRPPKAEILAKLKRRF